MKHLSSLTIVFLYGFFVVGCGASFQTPSINESGNETATEVAPAERSPAVSSPGGIAAVNGSATPVTTRTLTLDQATNVRKLVGGILEFVVELPPRAQITVPTDYQISQPSVRNSNGTVERSSTGFVGAVKIVSTPDGSGHLSDAQMASFNKIGLYVSASVVGASEGVVGNFKAIPGGAAGSGFNALYSSNGQPKFNYSAALAKRFGAKLNKAITPSDVAKYQKIFAELQREGDRKIETPKFLILMDREAAKKYSIAYETNGTVATNGAWTIAVTGTAVRHGFENVPCAEFMSESIREAYERAGYSAANDFPANNPMIWSKTASVEGLSNALATAGWVPWDSSKFRAPTGAIMMHGYGISPGHTFLAAGDDGRIVVDNGSPQGRDLRTTSASILKMMYKTGVFFLPPGINPQAW